MKKNLNSLKSKLIISLLGVSIIPLIFIALLVYNECYSLLKDNLKYSTGQTLVEVNRGIENYFNTVANQINSLTLNSKFIELDNSSESIKDIISHMNNIEVSDSNISTVFYGTENGDFYTSHKINLPDGYNHKEKEWYTLATANKDSYIITSPYTSAEDQKTTVTLARTVVKDGQVVGVVGLDLSLDVFSSSISNIKIGDEGVVVVCNSNGDIISHTDEGLIGKNLIEVDEELKSVVDDNSGFIELSNNGKRNFVVYNLNSLENIKLVAFIPEIELLKDTNAVRSFLIIGIIVIGIVAIIISIILGEGIAKNMKKVKNVISKAAKGDFTGKVEIKSKDDFKELGDYFNNMMESIALLMKNVDKSSQVVLKTAADLAIMSNETTTALSQTHIAMDEIASGASNQAESTIQCASHMEDLAQGIDNIENSSTEIDSISKDTKNYSIEGSKIVSELINSSTKIKDTFEVVGNIVKEVNESMDQINLISKTISDITEQTNLLSLNASIEAARSGEAGKGFAVVANEIRRLADQSKSSTDRINVMIKAIEEKSMLAVSAINNSQQVVDEEGKMVSETSQIFENISGSVLELSSKISEIKKSIENIQYEKINVVREIENVTSISESTASATEEISASTEEITANMDEISRYTQNLNELSEALKFEISKFIIE